MNRQEAYAEARQKARSAPGSKVFIIRNEKDAYRTSYNGGCGFDEKQIAIILKA
jgi:hypothetical protein